MQCGVGKRFSKKSLCLSEQLVPYLYMCVSVCVYQRVNACVCINSSMYQSECMFELLYVYV